MRLAGNSIWVLLPRLVLFGLVVCSSLPAGESSPAPSMDSLSMTCSTAYLWDHDSTSIAELHGPVRIELDHTKMLAENAVVWLSPYPGGPANSQKVQIALIGRAQLQQQGVLRLDRRLLVNAVVTGKIQMVGQRVSQTDDGSDLYLAAAALRDGKPATAASAPADDAANPTAGRARAGARPTTLPSDGLSPLSPLTGTTLPTTSAISPWEALPRAIFPATSPATKPVVPSQRFIQFDGDYDQAHTPDGSIAAVCSNGVNLRYQDNKGNLLEFVSRNMVLFTNLKQMKGANEGEDGRQFIADHIVGGYFEGDVQVYMTPVGGKTNELRMRAERVYYELDTDRAIMTDVLFHTVDAMKQIPIFIRAQKLRQLSQEEFTIDGLGLTNSAFATPTYSLQASHAYVRAEDTGDPLLGERVTFEADDTVVQAFGLPIFYFPVVAGSTTSKGSAFRTVDAVTSSSYGYGFRSRWGLFETVGVVPPKGLDASYTIDYLSKRGPAGGLDATYSGGFVSDATRQPWNFVGDFHSYLVDDHGEDVLGAARYNQFPEHSFRGRAIYEHQEFFPDGWQAQIRLGWVSDSNFMVQWFNDEYLNNLPVNDSIYLKHASESEQFSFLVEAQPNRAISTADEEEQNREISRLPELRYDRVGDSLLNDRMTFFSEDSVSSLKFVKNTQTLAQQGFYSVNRPGEPSYAYTGDPGETTLRGDARQELDFPINAGPVKVVPYIFGRYTGYSDSVIPPTVEPQRRSIPKTVAVGDSINRVMGGGGLRLTTDFWKVDNTVDSEIFDLHRLRHIVSPELNVFGSASNVDQNRLFIYDPQVDAVNDVEAVQLALRQRWQTKRGGPGRWRSVDFFTLDLYGNFFGNQPSNRFRDPVDFRGLFMYSNPEFSVPRNSANADASWRISDSMTILSDVRENLDRQKLATAAIGIAVQRDDRMTYYIANRYIADLNSNVITFELNYKLDQKYSVSATESLDLAQNKDVYYTFTLNRYFDNFSIYAQLYYDQATSNKGFSVNIHPLGTGGGVGSSRLTPPQ